MAKMRRLIRALALYGAGGWVAVEAVGFFQSTYDLPRIALDSTILLAVAGGAATAVVTWFHGESGRQVAPPLEKMLLGTLAVATLFAWVLLSRHDPQRAFHNLDGARLVLELPMPPPDQSEDLDIRWAPTESTVDLPFGVLAIQPDWFRLDMPAASVRLERRPVMFQWEETGEYARLTVILPGLPQDLRPLLENGQDHDAALIETGGFQLRLDRPFQIEGHADSVVIRLNGRFQPSLPDSAGRDAG